MAPRRPRVDEEGNAAGPGLGEGGGVVVLREGKRRWVLRRDGRSRCGGASGEAEREEHEEKGAHRATLPALPRQCTVAAASPASGGSPPTATGRSSGGARYSWTKRIATDPSPAAEATRFTEP